MKIPNTFNELRLLVASLIAGDIIAMAVRAEQDRLNAIHKKEIEEMRGFHDAETNALKQRIAAANLWNYEFEKENTNLMAEVNRLSEEVVSKQATITERNEQMEVQATQLATANHTIAKLRKELDEVKRPVAVVGDEHREQTVIRTVAEGEAA